MQNQRIVKTDCAAHTKGTIFETNFTWVIDNFSFIHGKVESQKFKTEFQEEAIKWSLIMRITNNWIVFSLNINSKYQDCKCFLSLSKKEHQVRIQNHGHAYNLYEVQKHFIENDRLTVYCKVQIYGDQSNLSKCSGSGTKTKLKDSLGLYLGNQKLSDVTLVVEDQEIPAHSQILAMRSSVFSTLLSGKDVVEQKRLILNDISHQVVLEMLRFIYTDRVKDLEEIVKELLVAAILYDIQQLKKMCFETIQKQIDISNVIDFLEFADKHCIIELKMSSMDFVKRNATAVKETASYKNLIGNPDLIGEICMNLAE